MLVLLGVCSAAIYFTSAAIYFTDVFKLRAQDWTGSGVSFPLTKSHSTLTQPAAVHSGSDGLKLGGRREGELQAESANTAKLANITCQAFWHDSYKGNLEACRNEAKRAAPRLQRRPIPHLPRRVRTLREGRAIVFTVPSRAKAVLALQIAQYVWSRWGTDSAAAEIHTESPSVHAFCEKQAKSLAAGGKTVVCVKAGLSLPASQAVQHNYAYKPLAVGQSEFRNVLFLDTDTVPLVDPRLLFESDVYRRHGAMFWPDLWGVACRRVRWGRGVALCGQSAWPEHVIFQTLNLTWRGDRKSFTHEFDTGMFLVATQRHEEALALSYRLANDDWVVKVLYGDKDCFRLAWLALGLEFGFEDFPHQLGHLKGGSLHRAHLLHYFEGTAAFVHQVKYKIEDYAAMAQASPLEEGNAMLVRRGGDYRGVVLSASPLCYDGCKMAKTMAVDPAVVTSMALFHENA